MIYNKKYNRWVSKDGLVYRYDSKQDKLILCKQSKLKSGYNTLKLNQKMVYVHRLVWETYNGEIQDGYVIDHLDTNKDNNSLKNLSCVTPKSNRNNPLTLEHSSRSKIRSEFGRKFFEHYGFSRYKNVSLYEKERYWYLTHNNTCRWEND